MTKFTKLHTYLKLCPNCDDYSRQPQTNEVLACNECNSKWNVEDIVGEYDDQLIQ